MAIATTTLDPGFGSTTISLVPSDGASGQAVVFGAGFNPADAILTLTDYDQPVFYQGHDYTIKHYEWTISFKNSSDVLTFVRSEGPLDTLGLLDHISFDDGTAWLPTQIIGTLRQTANAAHYVQGTSGVDTLTGDGRTLGLNGYGGTDTLVSSAGNETLSGGDGADTYVFSAGWGHDTVSGFAHDGDAIRFQAGVRASDIAKTRDGVDLLLTSSVDGSTLTLPWFFSSAISPDTPQGNTISFADGQVWTYADIYHELGFAPSTPYADKIKGTYSNELIDGGAGADVLAGGAGTDTLVGGVGDDTLTGGNDADVLEGGAGRDQINAGGGDTVVFRPGAGSDVVLVNDDYQQIGSVNKYVADPVTLSFLDGIKSTDVTIERIDTLNGSAHAGLLVRINSTGDSVLVRGQHDPASVFILNNLTLSFADGVQWTGDSLAAHTVTATKPTSADITGTAGADTLQALGWRDTVHAGAGSDTIYTSGESIIDVSGNAAGDIDTVVLADGVRPEDVRLLMPAMGYRNPLDNIYSPFGGITYLPPTYADLVIDTGAVQGQVAVRFPVPSSGQIFSQVALRFANGETWSPDEVRRRALAGSDGADKFYAYNGQADAFSFTAGRGSDVIYNFDASQDTLSIDTSDVRFSVLKETSYAGVDRYGSAVYNYATSILVTRADTGETLTLFNIPMFGETPFIRLANGLVLSGNELAGYTPGAGGNGDDLVQGDDGDNALSAFGGNDTLKGLDGKDTLLGGAGNDVLEGGKGDDRLDGGSGANTYVFNKGDGKDSVVAADWSQPQTLQLGAGIKPADVNLSISDVGAFGSPAEFKFTAVIGSGQDDLIKSTNVFDRIAFADGTVWTRADIDRIGKLGTPLDDTITGGAGNDYITGQGGIDWLNGLGGADTIIGGNDRDLIDGGTGADRFDGGAGNDDIKLGVDSDVDTVVFGRMDGDDVLGDVKGDVIEMKADIKPADVFVAWQAFNGGSAMVLAVKGEASTMTLYGTAGADPTVTVRFADNTVWTPAYLAAQKQHLFITSTAVNQTPSNKGDYLGGTYYEDNLLAGAGNDMLRGGHGNDTLNGGAGADTLRGDEGDDIYIVDNVNDKLFELVDGGIDTVQSRVSWTLGDHFENLDLSSAGSAGVQGTGNSLANTLTGSIGANTLNGGAGNDALFGLNGGDTLIGGLGHDTLNGGKGNDTYQFARGDGADVIVDQDSTWLNSDQLKLSNVTSRQLWLQHTGNDLVISVIGTNDKITVQDWYSGSANHVERITASDGKTLTDTRVDALVNAMAAFAPPAAGQTTLPTNVDSALSKVLASSWR